jgi:hypothetical protein
MLVSRISGFSVQRMHVMWSAETCGSPPPPELCCGKFPVSQEPTRKCIGRRQQQNWGRGARALLRNLDHLFQSLPFHTHLIHASPLRSARPQLQQWGILYIIIPWIWAVLDTPPLAKLLKSSPAFMETEDSLPCSGEPSHAPYPEPDQPVHTTPCYVTMIHLRLGPAILLKVSFFLAFQQCPIRFLFVLIRATCPAHFIFLDLWFQLPLRIEQVMKL